MSCSWCSGQLPRRPEIAPRAIPPTRRTGRSTGPECGVPECPGGDARGASRAPFLAGEGWVHLPLRHRARAPKHDHEPRSCAAHRGRVWCCRCRRLPVVSSVATDAGYGRAWGRLGCRCAGAGRMPARSPREPRGRSRARPAADTRRACGRFSLRTSGPGGRLVRAGEAAGRERGDGPDVGPSPSQQLPATKRAMSSAASWLLRPWSRVRERQVGNASACPIAARVSRARSPRRPRPVARSSWIERR
jgi:hypothetical protein